MADWIWSSSAVIVALVALGAQRLPYNAAQRRVYLLLNAGGALVGSAIGGVIAWAYVTGFASAFGTVTDALTGQTLAPWWPLTSFPRTTGWVVVFALAWVLIGALLLPRVVLLSFGTSMVPPAPQRFWVSITAAIALTMLCVWVR